MIARRVLATVVLLAALALPGAARATATVDHLTIGGVPVNVALPAGYDANGTATYPVVYLLHGYSENENTWIDQTDAEDRAAADGVLVVTPGGDPDGWYTDWRDGHRAWETFHFGTLIPYIDANYKTWGTRAGRAIAGLSMGGFGSMSYAARHPDLFVAAASFSGAVDITDKSPVAELAISRLYGPKDESDPYAIFGDPSTDDVWWHAPNPTDLAENLRGMSLYIASGSGVPELDDRPDPTGSGGEAAVNDMARNLDAALTREGIPHGVNYRNGLHIWKYWQRDLTAWWPIMKAAFGGTAPSTFDYRAVSPAFSVWGWSFAADAARAPEFLDVRGASCAGATLTGSGTETVTTDACFTPGATVALTGATTSVATADGSGRVTFSVDLGPAHTLQQYTAAERALDPVPGYFVTRSVTFA